MELGINPKMQNKSSGFAKSTSLYDTDFYAWTHQQAKLLVAGSWHNLDIPNLVEELEALGRQERRELENRLAILLAHLLKWQYQPDQRSNSWDATIREQRFQINRLIQQSPSLKPYLREAILQGYGSGLNLAVKETNLNYAIFPQQCPYAETDILKDNFLPDS
jgi:hypothetical protein